MKLISDDNNDSDNIWGQLFFSLIDSIIIKSLYLMSFFDTQSKP